jgi:hypothetical protein
MVAAVVTTELSSLTSVSTRMPCRLLLTTAEPKQTRAPTSDRMLNIPSCVCVIFHHSLYV